GILSILDAAALALLALSIGPIVADTELTLPVVGTVDDTGVIIVLGIACSLIILKGVLALMLMWRATRQFSKYELELGARLFDTYVESRWVERLKRNSSDIVRLT